MMNRTTDIVAAGAIASLWWVPPLERISQGAAMLLPVVGCIWLGIQIYYKLRPRR